MNDLYLWQVKNNFAEADFWLQNKGSVETVGTVIREYEEYLTGIKCPAIILPDYGYYLCEYLHQSGVWKAHAKGCTNLQHLRITDIRRVFAEIGRSHQAQFRQQHQHITPRRVKDREALF